MVSERTDLILLLVSSEKVQIFLLLRVSTVIDHRRHKNVVKTAVTHSSAPLCVTLL